MVDIAVAAASHPLNAPPKAPAVQHQAGGSAAARVTDESLLAVQSTGCVGPNTQCRSAASQRELERRQLPHCSAMRLSRSRHVVLMGRIPGARRAASADNQVCATSWPLVVVKACDCILLVREIRAVSRRLPLPRLLTIPPSGDSMLCCVFSRPLGNGHLASSQLPLLTRSTNRNGARSGFTLVCPRGQCSARRACPGMRHPTPGCGRLYDAHGPLPAVHMWTTWTPGTKRQLHGVPGRAKAAPALSPRAMQQRLGEGVDTHTHKAEDAPRRCSHAPSASCMRCRKLT